jgi:uncharacterized membrane protein
MIVGSSDIGVIDPQTGLPELRADFFYKGQVINMGTFGGTNSLANSINSRGQATGGAENTDPDPWNFGGLVGLPSQQLGMGSFGRAEYFRIWERWGVLTPVVSLLTNKVK